jgi:hypothetical protein
MNLTRIAARHSVTGFLFSLSLLCGLLTASSFAQQPSTADTIGANQAPIIVDGKKLFRVRGTSSYPASRRASEVRQRIIDLASDETFDPDHLTVSNEEPNRSIVMAGNLEILNIFDEDAALENVQRELLAVVHRDVIAEAIRQYRSDRSIDRLVNNSLLALAATLLFVFLLWANTRLFRWLVDWTERDVRRGVQELATKAHHLFHPHQLWAIVAGLLRFLRLVAYFVLTYFYLNCFLASKPDLPGDSLDFDELSAQVFPSFLSCDRARTDTIGELRGRLGYAHLQNCANPGYRLRRGCRLSLYPRL